MIRHTPKVVAVCMDETRFFMDGEEMCEDLRGKVKKVFGVYLYDDNVSTTICDTVRRFFMRWIDVSFEAEDGLSGEERERIQDLLREAYMTDDSDAYMEISEVEKVDEEHRKVFMEESDFEPWAKGLDESKVWDEVFESYSANPLF